MHIWTKEKMFSQAALSDCTDHKATPVMVSLTPVLSDLVNEGKRRINSISDSPTSQHQNKKIFWSVRKFCSETNADIKWMYPESGHSKRTPDEMGATVKKAVQDLILHHSYTAIKHLVY